MLSRRAISRFSGAFWALAVAWLCAQSPQAALFFVGEWAGGATRISHQERLMAEVERAMSTSGAEDSAASALAQNRADEPAGGAAALPWGGVVEKLLLALTERERLVGDESAEAIFVRAENWVLAGKAAGEPLHPPPRSV